jgi:NAD(P)-dependent dehydrogenase (short-subunit alcohol dehydrogenase family)
VNIGTMAAYWAGTRTVAYGASKAALHNLTKTMSQQWAPWKIRVNLLNPGPFTSEMVEGAARQIDGFKATLEAVTLQRRIAEPEEIVGPVIYLASDASSFVTGDDLSVSGGMRK